MVKLNWVEKGAIYIVVAVIMIFFIRFMQTLISYDTFSVWVWVIIWLILYLGVSNIIIKVIIGKDKNNIEFKPKENKAFEEFWKKQKTWVKVILIIFLIFIAVCIYSWYSGYLTGNSVNNAVNTQQTIIDNEQLIKENMYHIQTFEVFKLTMIFINITSDDFVNYALLPDYEVEHYEKGESFKSYANTEGILFIQDTYNLDVGKYSVVITSGDKPVNVHLIVKAIPQN